MFFDQRQNKDMDSQVLKQEERSFKPAGTHIKNPRVREVKKNPCFSLDQHQLMMLYRRLGKS